MEDVVKLGLGWRFWRVELFLAADHRRQPPCRLQ